MTTAHFPAINVEMEGRTEFTKHPRRLYWFGHATRRPNSELIKDLLLPTPPRTWGRTTGGQLKTWATAIKADLEPLSGP